MNQFWSGNECERTHTLTTTTSGTKNSQNEANYSVPPKGPYLTDSWSWMKSSARHTLRNQQAQLKEAETVNLIENDANSLSRPLACLL